MAKASKKRGKKKAAKTAKKSKAKKSVGKRTAKRKGAKQKSAKRTNAKRAPAKRKPAKRAPAKKRAPKPQQPEPWPVIFAVLFAVCLALVAVYFNNPAQAAAVGDLNEAVGASVLGLAVETVKGCGFDAVTAALPFSPHTTPN